MDDSCSASLPTPTLRELHALPPLVLANVWDPFTARLVEEAGSPAIATTSAAVAWASGRADGEGMTRDQAIDSLRRIVDVVSVPVTADMERGYDDGTLDSLSETVRMVINTGATGMNFEDRPGLVAGDQLVELGAQCERIEAIKATTSDAGVDFVLNARTDVYLAGIGEPTDRLELTLTRAKAFVEAGADCIFVPGLGDLATISTLTLELGVPLNIMAGPGSPSIQELANAGVARISVGPNLALAAADAVLNATKELLTAGSYGALAHDYTFPQAQALFN